MKRLHFIICFMCPILSVGQGVDTLSINPEKIDSVLSFSDYMRWVEAYHPVSVQADLQIDMADRKMQMARGGFDPLLYGNYRLKEYEQTEYYNALQAGLEIPTWFGLSLQAGYEENGGVFLNPENNVPEAGLINVGVTAELGAGLLMDSRRAAFRQAEIAQDAGRAERTLIRNTLYREAVRAYAEWALSYVSVNVALEALELATVRYGAVRESFLLGDLPAIDTVEAYTQVLNRFYNLREAQNNFLDAVNAASVYLWDEDTRPMFLRPGIAPDWVNLRIVDFNDISLVISQDHPELLLLSYDRFALDIDRRLAAEYLRPTIQLKYNFLTENVYPSPADDFFQESRFFANNYDFGAKVTFPLFVREARGQVGMAKIGMRSLQLDYDLKLVELQAQLNATLGKLQNLRDQIVFFRQNVELLTRLIEGERQLFEMGESSLFLVNAREINLIQGQNIYNSLIAKEKILRAEARYIAGQGFEP